jgi:hypothetical protein
VIFSIYRTIEIILREVESQFKLRGVHVLLAMKQQGGNRRTGDGRD